MTKADIATAYVAGYLYKEASLEKEAKSVWERIKHTFDPLTVPERAGAPISTTSHGLRGYGAISPLGYLAGTLRKATGNVLDWGDERRYADSSRGKADKWLGDRPYILPAAGTALAAAGLYAMYRKIQNDRAEKEEQDLKGLV